jgi:hypothetical protein
MKFLRFFFLFPLFLGFSQENNTSAGIWLKKINRQGETVSGVTVEEIKPSITNVNLIAGLIAGMQGSSGSVGTNWIAYSGEKPGTQKETWQFQKERKQPEIKIKKPSNSKQTEKLGQETVLHLRGYCFFDRNITVYGRLKMYATLPCAFEGIPQMAQVFGELVPSVSNYALLFVPKKVYINGIPFKVEGGYALSGDGSTVNVANEVNDQAIKKILASSGVDASKEASKMIEKSAEQAQTEVNVNGDVVVKKTEFDVDILGKSILWSGIASFVGNVANYFKEQSDRIPVTFKIYKGTKIYLDIDAKRIY